MKIIPTNDPKQTLRIKRFLMAFGTYIIWMLIALYCYYYGLFEKVLLPIEWIFVLIITSNLAIFFLLRSGLNLRFKDPSLTMAQVIIATVWTMAMAYSLDEGRGIMLLLYMVVFTFGTFKLNLRQFIFLSILALIGYGSVISLLLITYPKSINLKLEIFYLITLFIVLIWFSFIGSYINGLRKKLGRTNKELNEANNELKNINALVKQGESRYRLLAENAHDIISTMDTNLRFTYISPSITRIRGFTVEEAMSQTFAETLTPASLEVAMKAYLEEVEIEARDTKNLQRTRILELEETCKDGSTIWTETTFSPLRDEKNNFIGFLGITRDITERKQAEEVLRESEEKYRTILKNIDESYFETDLRGNYTFFNESLCMHLGYSRQELMDMNYKVHILPEVAKRVSQIFNEIYRTGKPKLVADHEIIRKDGSKRITEMSVSLMYSPTGEPIGFRGVGRDVTERIEAEQVIKESERRHRMITENVREVIWTMDFDMKFPYISPSIIRLTGYTPDEIQGMPLKEQMTSASYALVEKRLAEEFALENSGQPVDQGRLIILELELIRKDGGTVWVETTASFNRDENGKSIGILGVIRDITERKCAEEEKERLEDHLVRAQKMEAIGTLAGGIAHDFNNLLMGILGNISIMRMNFDDSHPFFDRLTYMEEYVQRGSDLTKQLLGFAQGGKYEIKPTHLGEFIRRSSEMFGRTKKEIRIHHKVPEALWLVEVDRGQIEQVLLNLYVNAWQAMPSGGDLYLSVENVDLDEMDVSFFDVKPGKYVKMNITDTGVGMDEATKARIFEPFFTTKERGRGTGLGLASVYGIIKNHGGFINVESEKHLGTSFLIFLPASDKKVVDEYIAKEDVQKGQETVLFIDDEDMVLDVGSKMIKGLGYEVMTAAGGKQGLEIYEQNRDKIDLVILDMIMPDFSGKETFDILQRINPSVRVLLSSGYSLEGQANEIMEKGCKAFIQKPFTMSELSNKIRGILDDRIVARNKILSEDSIVRIQEIKT